MTKTPPAILRGVLDNIAMTNMPQRGFVEGQVNIDDLLNNEIGGLVRMKQLAQYRDGSAICGRSDFRRTRILRSGCRAEDRAHAPQRQDPDALQNTTATAARYCKCGGWQVEVMARNLADGMTRLLS